MKTEKSTLYKVVEDMLQRTMIAVHEYEQKIQRGNLSDSEMSLYKSRISEYRDDITEIEDTLNFLINRKNDSEK